MMPKQLSIGDLNTGNEHVYPFMQRAIEKQEKRSNQESPNDVFARDLISFRLPQFVREFPIDKTDQTPPKTSQRPRPGHVYRWAFDFCFPEYKLIVEIDGGIWSRGAHGHPIDLVRNMHKRNDAAHAGFHVIAFSPDEVKKAKRLALEYTMRVLHARGWRP